MDPNSYPPASRVGSRLPMLIGVLIAVAVLWCLPTYLQYVEYSKTLGQVQAVNEVLPQIGPKLESLSKAFSVIARKVGPSVVFIDTEQTRVGNRGFGAEMQEVEGEASGVIIDPDGYIITNNHVVENAAEIRVTLANDNHQYIAKVIGTDPGADLAVIKIPATKLIAAEWGDSGQLEVGEWVLAIGNPYGLDRTVTFGIVSAKDRGLKNSPTQDFLQTDAAVNPGNSGGPLVNMAGKVVGINTAIYGTSYQGISFALPSSKAKEVYEQLKKGQPVGQAYGYLGVQLAPLSRADAQRLGVKTGRGSLVTQVVSGSPADQAGLKPDDVIIAWGGEPVDEPTLLRLVVARANVGATVKATIIRQGEEMQLDVTVGQRP